MKRECLHTIVIVVCVTLLCSSMVLTAGSAKAEETEILKITVGEPTKLSSGRITPEVAASRTGTVAAFYGTFYRISTDGGRSWGPQMDSPCGGPGPMSIGLREGGVLFMARSAAPID